MHGLGMAVRSLQLLGGGQSQVQKGTLLLMTILHQKKGTCSQKGQFLSTITGGGAAAPPPPPPPARYGPACPTAEHCHI